jgi:hypothetical protein
MIEDSLDNFKKELLKDMVDAPTNTSITMPQISLAMDRRLQRYHNSTVAPLVRPVSYRTDFISDVFVKGTMMLSSRELVALGRSLVIAKLDWRYEWPLIMTENIAMLYADRAIMKIPSSTIHKKIHGDRKGWQEWLLNAGVVGAGIGTLFLLGKTHSWLTDHNYRMAAILAAVTSLVRRPKPAKIAIA